MTKRINNAGCSLFSRFPEGNISLPVLTPCKLLLGAVYRILYIRLIYDVPLNLTQVNFHNPPIPFEI